MKTLPRPATRLKPVPCNYTDDEIAQLREIHEEGLAQDRRMRNADRWAAQMRQRAMLRIRRKVPRPPPLPRPRRCLRFCRNDAAASSDGEATDAR
jgi:hypothetical protein